MATSGRETPAQEAARMAVIAEKKAKLDATISDLKAKPRSASHLGTQMNVALEKGAEEAIQAMSGELDDLHLRTKVLPAKDPSTHTCLNTGLTQQCVEAMPRRFNTGCDLCGKINNKL